jgi:hypothetical protein
MKAALKECVAMAMLILSLCWHGFIVGDLKADFDDE